MAVGGDARWALVTGGTEVFGALAERCNERQAAWPQQR